MPTDQIFHDLYLSDDQHRHPEHHLTIDIEDYLEQEELYQAMLQDPSMDRRFPLVRAGILNDYLTEENQNIMRISRSSDPMYDQYSNILYEIYTRLDDLEPDSN